MALSHRIVSGRNRLNNKNGFSRIKWNNAVLPPYFVKPTQPTQKTELIEFGSIKSIHALCIYEIIRAKRKITKKEKWVRVLRPENVVDVLSSSAVVSFRYAHSTRAFKKKPLCYRIQLYSNIFYCKQKYHFRYYLTSSMLSHSHC